MHLVKGKRPWLRGGLRVGDDVTAGAASLRVSAVERKVHGVVEEFRRTKRLLPVAGITFARESVRVNVLVAGGALL